VPTGNLATTFEKSAYSYVVMALSRAP